MRFFTLLVVPRPEQKKQDSKSLRHNYLAVPVVGKGVAGLVDVVTFVGTGQTRIGSHGAFTHWTCW